VGSRELEKARARQARIDAQLAEERAEARARRVRRLVPIVGAAIVILIVAVVLSRIGSDEPAAVDQAMPAADLRDIPQRGPFLGPADAPAVLEEYADLQCPFCAEFSRAVLPDIVDRVREGSLRLRLRTLTFLGDDSVRAGRFAVAVGFQDRQWDFVDLFYARQGKENSGYATDAFLRDLAEQIPGLDVERAFRDRDSERVTRILREDAAAGDKAGVQGTPSFLAGPADGRLRPLNADPTDREAFLQALDAVAQGT
jgi:protein-disulfide isomerase